MQKLETCPADEKLQEGRGSLQENEYPGRIAIMGMNDDGDLALQAYAIMGRSPGSRNRIFAQEGTDVRTVAPDKTAKEMAATESAALIYYKALESREGVHVVSNGAQTGPVLDKIIEGSSLEKAIKNAPTTDGVNLSRYEPDRPNNTPRITGVVDLRQEAPTPFGLAVVRKDEETEDPVHSFYEASVVRDLKPGTGYGVQTYNGNGDPLPSFDQEPYAFPLGRDATDTAQAIWEVLNQDNRVSLAVRSIDLESGESTGTCIVNSRA